METLKTPKCIFCGANTRLSNKKTGREWDIVPSEENHWHGKMKDRRRHYILCNKCNARGPMKPTPEEALDAYRIASN